MSRPAISAKKRQQIVHLARDGWMLVQIRRAVKVSEATVARVLHAEQPDRLRTIHTVEGVVRRLNSKHIPHREIADKLDICSKSVTLILSGHSPRSPTRTKPCLGQAAEALRLRAQGMTERAIAYRVNLSRSTVQRILSGTIKGRRKSKPPQKKTRIQYAEVLSSGEIAALVAQAVE